MNIRFLFFLLNVLIIVTACNTQSVPIDVLRIVEKTPNHKELRTAIDHYQSPGDSLKLKALYFLIKNMDEQFSYQGKSLDNYKKLYVKFNVIFKSGIPRTKAWDSV